MHILGAFDVDNDDIEQWVELKLNSVLYSHFSTMTEFGDMEDFSDKIRTYLYDTMRGSQNGKSEIQPYLPFRRNPEKRCVEYSARQILQRNGTITCQPNCFHVKWEEAIYQAFALNGKFV